MCVCVRVCVCVLVAMSSHLSVLSFTQGRGVVLSSSRGVGVPSRVHGPRAHLIKGRSDVPLSHMEYTHTKETSGSI